MCAVNTEIEEIEDMKDKMYSVNNHLSERKKEKNLETILVEDSGASNHITNSIEGLVNMIFFMEVKKSWLEMVMQ